jgi:hypothetical protein
MRIRKIVEAGTVVRDKGAALAVLKNYGDRLFKEVVSAAAALHSEKAIVDAAVKTAGLDPDSTKTIDAQYDGMMKSVQYLASIADLLRKNDPVLWEDAKTTGVFRMAMKDLIPSLVSPSSSPQSQPGPAPQTQAPTPASAAPTPAAQAAPAAPTPAAQAAPAAPTPASPTPAPAPKPDAPSAKAFREAMVDIGKKANDDSIWNAPVSFNDMAKTIVNMRDVVTKDGGNGFLASKFTDDIIKVLKFYAIYSGHINSSRSSVAKGGETSPIEVSKLDKGRYSREKAKTKIPALMNKISESPDPRSYFIKNIFIPVWRYVGAIKGEHRKPGAVVANTDHEIMYRIRRIAASGPSQLDQYRSKFSAHIEKIVKHVASIYSGISSYAKEDSVIKDPELSDMLSTVLKTLRWSATLASSVIDKDADMVEFWADAKKNGLQMMEEKKMRGIEADPDDILADAIQEAIVLVEPPPETNAAAESGIQEAPTPIPAAEETTDPNKVERAMEAAAPEEGKTPEPPAASSASPASPEISSATPAEGSSTPTGVEEGEVSMKDLPGEVSPPSNPMVQAVPSAPGPEEASAPVSAPNQKQNVVSVIPPVPGKAPEKTSKKKRPKAQPIENAPDEEDEVSPPVPSYK